ncbi:hypothetical protein NDN08_005087 [Rhodosorus marinus]|uniref:AB hydrolase-1 domain-containing protein n=1 Tax=Rhodosorus marinus TaxID=101924 RepID=A0AAV8V3Z3_9RHOD|nr:hypothetical protein NDN08_005087 [Rhodosorus marinus]
MRMHLFGLGRAEKQLTPKRRKLEGVTKKPRRAVDRGFLSFVRARSFFRKLLHGKDVEELESKHPVKWSVVEHRGAKTDVFYIGPKAPKNKVLIVPGNPGCAEWYVSFARAIEDKTLSNDTGIYGLSLLGHSLRNVNDWRRTFSVEDQIEITEQLARDIKPSVLVGHSFGAHVCSQVLKRYNELMPRSSVVLLMPLTQCARRMTTTMKFSLHQHVREIITSGTRLVTANIPLRFGRAVVRAMGLNENAEIALSRMAGCLPLFRNIIYLADDERKQIKGFEFDLFRSMQGRVFYYHVQNDMWDTKDAFEEYRRELGDDGTVDDKFGTEHAFVLRDEQVERVASAVSSFIDDRRQ